MSGTSPSIFGRWAVAVTVVVAGFGVGGLALPSSRFRMKASGRMKNLRGVCVFVCPCVSVCAGVCVLEAVPAHQVEVVRLVPETEIVLVILGDNPVMLCT